MKNRRLYVAVVVLTQIMLSCLTPTVNAIISGDDAISITEQNISYSKYLNSVFADNRVLVVLTNEASLLLSDYNTLSFPEIECSNVANLTEAATAIIQEKVANTQFQNEQNAASKNVVPSSDDINTFEAFNQILCITLESAGRESVLNAIELLEERDDVLYAGPDYLMEFFTITPNDEHFNTQGEIDNMAIKEGWDIETGDSSVVVGVIDSGIAATHEDLINVTSYNMSRNCFGDGSSTSTIFTDDLGHGTGVASIIGAEGNNEEGICGVSWETTVVSLRVLDDAGNHYCSYVINAINYATQAGIPILNYSGGSETYSEALLHAIANYPGLFVCAVGNDGQDIDVNPVYPAAHNLSNIIAVGSVTSSDRYVSTSNYGKNSVDLFATGDLVLTCYPMRRCMDETCNSGTHYKDGYHYAGGTSFAAPYVTGVAALILAHYPNLTAAQIKERIILGVDIVYDSNGDSVLGERCTSGGRLNAYKALHPHTFNYSSVPLTHTGACPCGVSYKEKHTWRSLTVTDSSGANITITTCSVCGFKGV